jgi:hypothetical protein
MSEELMVAVELSTTSSILTETYWLEELPASSVAFTYIE